MVIKIHSFSREFSMFSYRYLGNTYSILSPVVTCDDPTVGSLQYSSVDVGAEARYSCNEGFLLKGAPTRVCQTDASWSGEAPICERGLFYTL